MATTHGRVGEFDSNLEDWTSYTERLQQYFTANDVAEDKQGACQENFYLPKNYYPRTKLFSKSIKKYCPILKIFVPLV